MSEKVLIDRELLAKATMLPSMKSLEENRRDIVERGRAQAEIRELLAAQTAAPAVQGGAGGAGRAGAGGVDS